MEREIHDDLKKVLANINRLQNFDDYLKSDEFNNILLECGVDDFWKKNISYTGILGLQDYNKTLINCLNFLLNYWSNNNGHAHVAKELNEFLKNVFIGYIEFNNEEKNFSKLLQVLYFGPITDITINEIKNSIDEKKNLKKEKNTKINLTEMENYDYAIITALEDDEMEKILDVATIENEVQNKTYLLRQGFFNSNPTKKILFVTQNYTGLVDSSILSTEIISKYKPKLIIMSGVLGGKPDKTRIGDVIVATKVFTIDKGKIEKNIFLKEIESSNINNRYINVIKSKKTNILDYIRDKNTEKKVVDIHFEPIACVRQVIDKEGFFNENLSSLDRKTLGVEMESYGVVRATELANEGKTDVLIIKSVMDNTVDKTDSNKKFAGFTSATVVEYLFKENLV